MNYEKMQEIITTLGYILMKPFEFCGIKVEINYISRARHSKDWVIQPHYHPWFEFNYVIDGSVFTKIDDREFLVGEGNSYLITPGMVHSHRHNSTGDDGVCIRFSLEPVCEKGEEIINVLSKPRYGIFESMLESLPPAKGTESAKAGFCWWIMELYESWQTDPPKKPSTGDTVAAQINLYLNEYKHEKIRMEDLSNALNISYRTLARRFKEETGETISEKLTKIRLETARQLLMESNMTLYDIAEAVGYENEFYFSNTFKKHYGMSPSIYRKNNDLKS